MPSQHDPPIEQQARAHGVSLRIAPNLKKRHTGQEII